MIGNSMVKIVVNPGRRVWVRGEGREAGEGEVLDVKDVEARILKFRGMADYAPVELPPNPVPPPPPPTTPPAPPKPRHEPPPTPLAPPAPPTPPAPEEKSPQAELMPHSELTPEDERLRQRRQYRRRDLRPEE